MLILYYYNTDKKTKLKLRIKIKLREETIRIWNSFKIRAPMLKLTVVGDSGKSLDYIPESKS